MSGNEDSLQGWWADTDRLIARIEAESALREQLMRKLDDGAIMCPVGRALVLAAGDWHRAGRMAPIPWGKLRRQAIRRVEPLRMGQPVAAEELEAGLDWAVAEPSLLVPGDAGNGVTGYAAPDELRHQLTHYGSDGLPGHVLLDMANPLQAVGIGAQIVSTHENDPDLALRAWRQVIEAEGDDVDEDAAALARWHLACHAWSTGDTGKARAGFAEVVVSGHFDAVPRAMLDLARLELDHDTGAAQALLRKAVRSQHPDVLAEAAGLLATVHERSGDLADAESCYRLALAASPPSWCTPRYALHLGRLLGRKGDLDAARNAYQQAIDAGFPPTAEQAATELADLLLHSCDVSGAKRALSEAVDASGLLAGQDLLLTLAQLHVHDGETDEAEILLGRVRSHPLGIDERVGTLAGFLSARILAVRGEDDQAYDLFDRLLNTTDPDESRHARRLALAFGEELRESGRIYVKVGYEPLLRFLMDTAPPDTAGWAAYSAGRLAEDAGRIDDATAAYHAVITAGAAPAELVGWAYADLGRLYTENGNRRSANQCWRKGRDHPDPGIANAFRARRRASGRVAGPRRSRSRNPG